MSSPVPPNNEPLTRTPDGTPSLAWKRHFDRMSREMDAVRALGGFGSLLPVAHGNPVPGYLPANGATISRTDNPGTFEMLGTEHGTGDGSTTFNLPTVADDGPIRWHVRVESA